MRTGSRRPPAARGTISIPATSAVKRPEWFPAYWGGEQGIAKWRWTGGHGAIVYAELMKRGAPTELVIATAAAHFDPFWEVDKVDGKEGLNAALAEGAKLAGVPAPKVDPAKRMAEWWMIVYSDGSWSSGIREPWKWGPADRPCDGRKAATAPWVMGPIAKARHALAALMFVLSMAATSGYLKYTRRSSGRSSDE